MSCDKECKCVFSPEQIWSALRLPVELISNIDKLDVYMNGRLLVPSFIFKEKACGEYDLIDNLLVFKEVKNGDIVDIRGCNSRYFYIRENYAWQLRGILER